VLAPGDLWRDKIVPAKRATASLTVDVAKLASKPKRPHHRYLMAQLMRRVFGLEVLRCLLCRRQRTLMSVIFNRTVIVRFCPTWDLNVIHRPSNPQGRRPNPNSRFDDERQRLTGGLKEVAPGFPYGLEVDSRRFGAVKAFSKANLRHGSTCFPANSLKQALLLIKASVKTPTSITYPPADRWKDRTWRRQA
jgi:hypothetical protein